MEKLLLGIIILSLLLSMFYFDETIAQTLSNPVSTLPTQQATDSTVVVTVTATPPATFTSRYWQIRWKYNGHVIGNAMYEYNTMNTSASVTDISFSPTDISATFPIGPNNQFNSSFKIQKLQLGDNGSVICVEGDPAPPPPQCFTLMVKNCPSTISSDITMEATSYIYNAQGTFECLNNGELFHSNGRPSSSGTTCVASATWRGQDNLQCWSAPVVTLGGDLTVVEGNNLTITCDYVETTPIGTESIFYVGNAVYTGSKNEALVLQSLQRSDDNKVVSCQAVTPYTQIPANNNTGRSKKHTINVQYGPYQENRTLCTWVVNQTGSCKVVFFSNPKSKFVSLISNVSGTSVINDGFNEISSFKYIQTFYFNRVKVTDADNGAYVLLVQISAFPNHVSIFFDINIINNHPTTPIITTPTMNILNSNITLIIGVSSGAFVALILLIVVIILVIKKRRNGKIKDNNHSSTLHPESNEAYMMNTLSHGGEREERVNPLYGASISQGCVDTTDATVDNKDKKGNKEEKINPLYTVSSEPVEQVGVAYAEVDVKKKKNKIKHGVSSKKEEKINPLYASSDQPEQIDAAYAEVSGEKKRKTKDQTKKENKINPLYISSDQPERLETAYAAVDLERKTKKEAMNENEERINPLYTPSSSGDQVEEAYAAFDKNKKKSKPAATNEKEERVNPLYAPSSSHGDHIEEAYAAVDKNKKISKPAAKSS